MWFPGLNVDSRRKKSDQSLMLIILLVQHGVHEREGDNVSTQPLQGCNIAFYLMLLCKGSESGLGSLLTLCYALYVEVGKLSMPGRCA